MGIQVDSYTHQYVGMNTCQGKVLPYVLPEAATNRSSHELFRPPNALNLSVINVKLHTSIHKDLRARATAPNQMITVKMEEASNPTPRDGAGTTGPNAVTDSE